MGPWNLQDRLGRDHQDSKLVYVSLGTRFRITRIQFSNHKWVLANLGSKLEKCYEGLKKIRRFGLYIVINCILHVKNNRKMLKGL